MSFDKLIAKVLQCENALEAQERQVAADVRQLKASWRAAWTPGRIVLVGMVSGFLVGRVEPLRNAASSGSVVRIVSLLSGLFASSSAHAAADDAALSAGDAADAAAPDAAAARIGLEARPAPMHAARVSETEPLEP